MGHLGGFEMVCGSRQGMDWEVLQALLCVAKVLGRLT